MERALPSESRIRVGAPVEQGAFWPRALRPRDDDFPRPMECPEVVLDLDDNCRRAVGALLAESRDAARKG